MKYCIAIFFIATLFSCNSKSENVSTSASNTIVEDTSANYFPVTNFLKGDIKGIKSFGTTPLFATTINGKTDSIWLKIDSIENYFQDFLEPRIDSANLKKYFKEESFLDKTLATFTFSYSRRANTTYNFPFINWDVMIDEESKKIKRIYLVKKVDDTTIKQLTWQAEKWCKIVTITKNKVVKEEKYTWDFNED